jgi:hypothetical protein
MKSKLFLRIFPFVSAGWFLTAPFAAYPQTPAGGADLLPTALAMIKGNESSSNRIKLHYTVSRTVSEMLRKEFDAAKLRPGPRVELDESDLDVHWIEDGGKVYTSMVRSGKAPKDIYGSTFKTYSAGGVTRLLYAETKGGVIDLTQNVVKDKYVYSPWGGVFKNAKGELWSEFIQANRCTYKPDTMAGMIQEDKLEILVTRKDGVAFALSFKPSLSFVPVRTARINAKGGTDEEANIAWEKSADGPRLRHVEKTVYFWGQKEMWAKTILDVKEADGAVKDLSRLAQEIFPEGTTVNDKITNMVFTAGKVPDNTPPGK